jgi:two-component system OmpR family response regulator
MNALIIDDDVRLAEFLRQFLSGHQVTTTVASDGTQGLAAFDAGSFDIVLLDLMMPGINGLDVCKQLRSRSQVPIIMLTAKGDEADRVLGLELGADDYLPKPFGPRELLARMRAVARRSGGPTRETLLVGALQIDVANRAVLVAEQAIDLTALEFDLLLALARNAGNVVPRDLLMREAGRGDTLVGERTVDVHISKLRHKVDTDNKNPLIRTVRGVGYLMVKP